MNSAIKTRVTEWSKLGGTVPTTNSPLILNTNLIPGVDCVSGKLQRSTDLSRCESLAQEEDKPVLDEDELERVEVLATKGKQNKRDLAGTK